MGSPPGEARHHNPREADTSAEEGWQRQAASGAAPAGGGAGASCAPASLANENVATVPVIAATTTPQPRESFLKVRAMVPLSSRTGR